jgi:choline-sulfatase
MTDLNIIYIYCDELRTDALGCYGNKYAKMKTPNIDRITEMGVRFENCFCNSPVCIPSRVSNLTGLYPEDTGVYHNEAAQSSFHLDRKYDTVPEVLARNGYKTANFGKVHLPQELYRNDKGNTIYHYSNVEGSQMMHVRRSELKNMIAPQGFKTGRRWSVIGGKFPSNKPYPSEKVTSNALNWLKEVKGPYFLRISYLQPHTPVLTPPPYDTIYNGENFPKTIEYKGELSEFEQRFAQVVDAAKMTKEEVYHAQVYYYGLVAWIDAQIGKIFELLESKGQIENTIIFFSADHGVSLGENGCYAKQIYAPQVHRVPLLISGPNIESKDKIREDICESLDLPKTLFNLVGIETPEQFKGRDLFSSNPPKAVFSTIGFGFSSSFTFPMRLHGNYLDGNGWPRRACIRTNEFRLDKNVRMNGKPIQKGKEDFFLVNWKDDMEEIHNLARDPNLKDTLERLSTMLDDHISNSLEPPEEQVFLSQ